MLDAAGDWREVDLDVLSQVGSEFVAFKLGCFRLNVRLVRTEWNGSSRFDFSHVDVIHVRSIVNLVADDSIRNTLLEAVFFEQDPDSVHVAVPDDVLILFEHTVALRQQDSGVLSF